MRATGSTPCVTAVLAVAVALLAGCQTQPSTAPGDKMRPPIEEATGAGHKVASELSIGQDETVPPPPDDDFLERAQRLAESMAEAEPTADEPSGDLDLGFTDADIATMRQMLDDPATDPGLRTTNQLEYDLATGVLTVDDYTRYAVYRWFHPDEVPAEYRLPPEVLEQEGLELTIPMWVAMRYWDHVQPETCEELEGFFGMPPER